jgi:Scd6-like Sm domain
MEKATNKERKKMERFRTHSRKKRNNKNLHHFFLLFVHVSCVCKPPKRFCVNLIGDKSDNNSFFFFCSSFFHMPMPSMTNVTSTVRSFGTEDRETPYPIMPQPTVYDYILFRGSDIKDIRVVNNVAIPNDPAIMQMHLPPGQMAPQQNFTPQNFPPMQGQPQPQMGQFGPFGGLQGSNMPQQQQAQSPVQQGNNTSNLAPGSGGSGQKNKKSSECSKENAVEKSAMTEKSSRRKQSNKSQGVHFSFSHSLTLSLAAASYFCIIFNGKK